MHRKEFLKGGLAAASLLLPLPYALVWAQSDGAMKLLRVPKVALVVGNSRYRNAPELKNASNDARMIGDMLKEAGFEVTVNLDAGLDEIQQSIAAHVHLMQQGRHVGLFYFAGHGVQLDWKNYLIPVDAAIETINDVPQQCVDLVRLMEGLSKAPDSMNVLILDACRDNPFREGLRVEQKGLSQMDAPKNTLLAYATNPGNVASDGDGVNGLYTEHLLREMKVQAAKIEDVFKRVRLGVRRKSNGRQIPWESTSLEEDFWFFPPKQPATPLAAEQAHLFNEELVGWERVRQATEPGLLEEYLRRYPNGYFSEIAQLHLDRVLARLGEVKIAIAPQQGNPYTKGSVEATSQFKVGDSYGFRTYEPFSGVEQSRYTQTVTQITASEVIYDDGSITDLLGNRLRGRDDESNTPRQQFPLEYAVGKRWATRFESTNKKGKTGTSYLDLHIAAREQITVPAGTFDAYRIEGYGFTDGMPIGPIELRLRWWMAPGQVGRPIRTQISRRAGRRIMKSERIDLVSFKAG